MSLFKGVGQRIAHQLRATGYVKENGDLKVQAFALDHRFPGAFVYDWLADRRTPIKDLERLAAALQATPSWLLFGGNAVSAPVTLEEGRTSSARRTDRALPEGKAPKRRPRRVAPIRGGSDVPSPTTEAPPPERITHYQTLEHDRWWPIAA